MARTQIGYALNGYQVKGKPVTESAQAHRHGDRESADHDCVALSRAVRTSLPVLLGRGGPVAAAHDSYRVLDPPN
jgi:hypothetical protein